MGLLEIFQSPLGCAECSKCALPIQQQGLKVLLLKLLNSEFEKMSFSSQLNHRSHPPYLVTLLSISTFLPSFGSNHKSLIHPGLDRNSVGAPSSSCSTPGNRYKSHKSSPLLLKIQLHDLPKTQKKHPNHTRGINAWKMAYNHPTEVWCYRNSPQTSPLSNLQSLQSVNSANKKSKFKHAWQPSFTVSFPPVPITSPSFFCFPNEKWG